MENKSDIFCTIFTHFISIKFFNIFSIEAVFAYLCKLDMLARWDKLDVETGKETFRQIIENLRGEARVPEEFQAQAPHVRDLMSG